MTKTEAIKLLGGTRVAAARAIGVSYQAVRQWPDVLTERIEDRVIAAHVRLMKAKRRRRAPAGA